MQIVRYPSLVPTPWKNGGGVTREAIRIPPGRDRYAWRVSFAQIDKSGPFSDFSGYQRHMVLLRGGGVRLEFADGARSTLKHAGDHASFDGAAAVRGELLAGPCIDLNLIISKDLHTVSAGVEDVRGPVSWPPARGESTLIVALDAGVVVEDERGGSANLGAWDLATGPISSMRAPAPCRVFIAHIVDNEAAAL
jgi:environmental stress-induced protein Ves